MSEGDRFVQLVESKGVLFALTADGRVYRKDRRCSHDKWVRDGGEQLFETDADASNEEIRENSVVCPVCRQSVDRRYDLFTMSESDQTRVCRDCWHKSQPE